MKQYLLALDQGTTSSRSIIFDADCNIVSISQKEYPQLFPHQGWVEHNPYDIYYTQLETAKDVLSLASVSPSQIAAIGITNQRETLIVWEKESGKPICNAIVWQCRRTADACEELRRLGYGEMIRQKTGLVIDSYFSATKLAWILKNIPNAAQRAKNGELLCGTVDSWLIYNLTGGQKHVTDTSNASRTMLFNINTMQWDTELLSLFDIPLCMMPTVCDSCGIFGYTDPSLFGVPIPIAGVAGDQQAALFGQCCYNRGDVKNTYGTGAFLLMNTGTTPVYSEHGLITTVGWTMQGKTNYVLEGSVFICGAAIQWLRDSLQLLEHAMESEAMALSVPDTDGVYFVPAFVGLGAPYWDPYARGAIYGLTRGTTKAHIVRAALEAMAYQTADVLHLMERELQTEIADLRVDGGASANTFLMQFQSDILHRPILRPTCIETTALGAAFLAGLGVGFFGSVEEIAKKRSINRIFNPIMSDQQRTALLDGWRNAVKRTINEK